MLFTRESEILSIIMCITQSHNYRHFFRMTHKRKKLLSQQTPKKRTLGFMQNKTSNHKSVSQGKRGNNKKQDIRNSVSISYDTIRQPFT